MKSKGLFYGLLFLLFADSINFTFAEVLNMEGFFDEGNFWKNVYPVRNPITVRIRISNTAEEIQKIQRVDMHVIYENPADSGETGYWNKRLSRRDIGLFSAGQQIKRGDWLPTETKPRPLTDADFIQMQPGEEGTMDWRIDLSELDMLEGKHKYELFLAGNHTLESVAEKIAKETKNIKRALTVGTQSNTVTFTFTKLRKDTQHIPQAK